MWLYERNDEKNAGMNNNRVMNTPYHQKSCKGIPEQTHTGQGISDGRSYRLRFTHPSSGMGRQTWQFTAVKSRENQELAAADQKVLKGQFDMYQPEVIIIPMPCNDRESPLWTGRMTPAPWKIYSWQPHSMGIGSVWSTNFQGICDEPSAPCVRYSHPLEPKTMWFVDWPHWDMRMTHLKRLKRGTVGKVVIVG